MCILKVIIETWKLKELSWLKLRKGRPFYIFLQQSVFLHQLHTNISRYDFFTLNIQLLVFILA